MPLYRPLEESYADEIVSLWNSDFDIEYRLTKPLLQKKLFNDADYFPQGSFVCEIGEKIVGFIASKISDNTLPEYQDTGWISLFAVSSKYRGLGIGSKLLSMAESAFKEAGIRKILIAGEMHCFFSGIPQPSAASIEFFKKAGCILSEKLHYDLTYDLSKADYRALPGINHTPVYTTRPAKKQDIPKISEFMKTEFPGRWDFEIASCFETDELSHVLLLWKQDKIKGFCRIRYGYDTDGIETYLGDNCGALGPIGIANDIRGEGLGKRILYDSLIYLQNLGARRTNIDWTVLVDFYGSFGFTPWRAYLAAYKTL